MIYLLFHALYQFTSTITAAISVGDKLPESTLSYFDATGEIQTVTVFDLIAKKKTIVFAVPGAFMLTCSQKHLPGFVEQAADLRSKGVDTMAKAVVKQVVENYYRPDLKNVALTRLSVVRRSLQVAKSGVKKRNR